MSDSDALTRSDPRSRNRFILLFFMFFAGQPFYLLNLFIQGVGYHIQWFTELTFSTQAFEQEGFYDESDCVGS